MFSVLSKGMCIFFFLKARMRVGERKRIYVIAFIYTEYVWRDMAEHESIYASRKKTE